MMHEDGQLWMSLAVEDEHKLHVYFNSRQKVQRLAGFLRRAAQ